MAKTKLLTDIEIAKAEVKRQKETREGNYQEFRQKQDYKKQEKAEILERLKKAGHI